MKTALYTAHQINAENMTPAEVIEEARYNPITESQIKQIQLDAMKEGMRRAAEVAYKINDGHDWPVTRAILTAAEQLTEKDL